MAGKRSINASDVGALRKLFSDSQAQVFAPSDDGYEATIECWSQAAKKPAGLSVVPSSNEGVAIAVKYATDHNIDLAVKGGGHSTSGASSTNGGLLISLAGMRKVRIDTEKKHLYVQGGCNWADVNDAAWEHGLATVGGTVADTGVGGLSLGGGYGILSGQRGLVIDNMVGATVVLANGDIKHVSEDENSDLFWALRGAGQNFGVTTEFVLQAFDQGEIFCGQLAFPPEPEIIGKLVTAVNTLYEQKPAGSGCKDSNRASVLMGFCQPHFTHGATMVLLVCAYMGPESEGREIFKPILDIGPAMNTMAMISYPIANNLVPAKLGKRSSMKGASFVMPLQTDFVLELRASFDAFMAACPDAADTLLVFEFYNPTTVASLDNGSFANRGYHLNGLVLPTWSLAENDQQCRQWARDVSNLFKKELERRGKDAASGVEGGASVRGHKGAVMLYGNYDQYDEISRDIFGSNYPRLQSLKTKYDPTSTFNKLFPIHVDHVG